MLSVGWIRLRRTWLHPVPKVRSSGIMLKPCCGNVQRWVRLCGARSRCSFLGLLEAKRNMPVLGQVDAISVYWGVYVGPMWGVGRQKARGCGGDAGAM